MQVKGKFVPFSHWIWLWLWLHCSDFMVLRTSAQFICHCFPNREDAFITLIKAGNLEGKQADHIRLVFVCSLVFCTSICTEDILCIKMLKESCLCCLSLCGSSTSAVVLNSLLMLTKLSELPESRDGTLCLCGGSHLPVRNAGEIGRSTASWHSSRVFPVIIRSKSFNRSLKYLLLRYWGWIAVLISNQIFRIFQASSS